MKISVITITLNSGKYVRRAMESVLAQDYPHLEYVVVDGGSSDDTLAIIRDVACSDTRVRFLSEPDRGIADAMNKGAGLTGGDVVFFLHADDFFADDTVLSRVDKLFEKHPSVQWLTGGVRHVDLEGQPVCDMAVRRYSYERLLRCNILFHPATFVKRTAFVAAGGFDAGLRYAMDYDLWLRLGKTSSPLTVNDVFTCFRVHDGSRSCLHIGEAYAEEWEVRRRSLAAGTLSYFFHWTYYQAKKGIHGRGIKRHLQRSKTMAQ